MEHETGNIYRSKYVSIFHILQVSHKNNIAVKKFVPFCYFCPVRWLIFGCPFSALSESVQKRRVGKANLLVEGEKMFMLISMNDNTGMHQRWTLPTATQPQVNAGPEVRGVPIKET